MRYDHLGGHSCCVMGIRYFWAWNSLNKSAWNDLWHTSKKAAEHFAAPGLLPTMIDKAVFSAEIFSTNGSPPSQDFRKPLAKCWAWCFGKFHQTKTATWPRTLGLNSNNESIIEQLRFSQSCLGKSCNLQLVLQVQSGSHAQALELAQAGCFAMLSDTVNLNIHLIWFDFLFIHFEEECHAYALEAIQLVSDTIFLDEEQKERAWELSDRGNHRILSVKVCAKLF